MAVAAITLAFSNGKHNESSWKIDNSASTSTWIGRKVTGEHTGTIKISEGIIHLHDGRLSGGNFTIDMNSISCTDLTDTKSNQKLVGHLKSDDFFSSEKHPKATFVITRAMPIAAAMYEVTGDLTIKGITKPITFPATVLVEKDKLTASAKITVDRTKYDIRYGSNSFFENLGNKAIDNNFDLNVELVAKR